MVADNDAHLPHGVEHRHGELFVAQLAVELLDLAVLSGRSWVDVGGVGADLVTPLTYHVGNELWSVLWWRAGLDDGPKWVLQLRVHRVCPPL